MVDARAEQWRPIEELEIQDDDEFLVYRPDAGVFSAIWYYPPHEDGGRDYEAEPTLFAVVGGDDLTNDMPTHFKPLGPGPGIERGPDLVSLAPEMVGMLAQYRDDLRHSPTPESKERRLEAVIALLSRLEGEEP